MIQDGLQRIDPTQMDGAACPAEAIERVSESDRMLVSRLDARIVALQAEAQGLQSFVTGHLSAVYGLQPGDEIKDDGTIARTHRETD